MKIPASNNPFATAHTDAVPYRFQAGDWNSNLQSLKRMNFHGAVVGPKGTGKTTLLEALQVRLVDQFGQNRVMFRSVGWQLKESRKFVAELLVAYQSGSVILVDSLERLPFLQRRKLLRLQLRKKTPETSDDKVILARGIVITCHRPCRIPTWIQTSGAVESLQHVLSYLPGIQCDQVMMEKAKAALNKHNGNVRNAIRDLYDQCAVGELKIGTERSKM